jgi:hypothetical protein
MFDLNSGEVFVVVFILTVVVSAPLWPTVGEWIAVRVSRRGNQAKDGQRR